MLERRFTAGPLVVDGRTLRGRAIRYGDEATIATGFGTRRETFARGAFGDVGKLDTTLGPAARSGAGASLARGGGGLVLTQGRRRRSASCNPARNP